MKPILLAVCSLVCLNTVFAQQYTVNGNASQVNCHCYNLTPNASAQSGSVWNNNKIDLNNSFSFVFSVNLGCTDVNGADGIAFVLQPISTSIGGTGSGLGFGGISPSIGVTLDTYQNGIPDNDPFYDHIAIQRNGILDHLSTDNLAGPIPISGTSNDVEDCLDHQLTISWDAVTKNLLVLFDGIPRVSVINDLVNTTFGGNPLVYWGFTGSTGALFNLQKFCTSLTPQWNFTAAQKRCVNEPITFYDATIAFSTVTKIYWNFGDGPAIDSVNINPTHIYTVPGDYTVTQTVLGADGCIETNTQIVRVGSKPVAWFNNLDSCVNTVIHFNNLSTVVVGALNNYYWDLDDGGITSTLQTPTYTYSTAGIKNIKLVAISQEGCVSDTLVKPIKIHARPVADFNFTDSVCLGTPIIFTDNSSLADGPVNGWVWLIDNANAANNAPTLNVTFLTPGNHTISLATTGTAGADCLSPFVVKNVFIRDKPIAAFTTGTICQDVSTVFTDASSVSDGAPINYWWWHLSNGAFSFSPAPSYTYNIYGPDTVSLVVATVNGCWSDTLKQPIFVHEKPKANFGIDALVCYGTPIQFHDSSYLNNTEAVNNWSWIYQSALWSSQQNPSGLFNGGPQTMGLSITNTFGCVSDTVYKVFDVNPQPKISMNFKDECKFTPVNFTGTIIVGNIDQWHWSFGDAAMAADQNPVHTYTANGTYQVSLYVIDMIGCSSDTLKNDIIIYGTNAFAGHDTIAAANQPVQLNAVGGLSYTWTPSLGLNSTTIANPVAILTATQTYTVKAFTPEGCESYDDVTVKIYKGPDIYLPTAFTPNDDGLNDVFRGVPVGLKEFRYLKVYNRWGQEVFSTTDYHNGWDGSWKGAKQSSGVFVVIANGIDFMGNVINKKSTVMLIR